MEKLQEFGKCDRSETSDLWERWKLPILWGVRRGTMARATASAAISPLLLFLLLLLLVAASSAELMDRTGLSSISLRRMQYFL